MTNRPHSLRTDIRRAPIFARLPENEIDALATVVQTVTLPHDTILFKENETGDCLYIIQDGELEIIKAFDTDQERLLSVCGPGEVIGEMSLLTPNVRRSASVRVRNQATLLAITHDDFEALMDRRPKLALDVIRILSERLRNSDDATIRDLRRKNLELGQAYADLEAAQQQIVEQEALRRELQHAYQIQQNMLPSALPVIQGVDLGARMIPARMVGGDFYDVLHLPDENRLVFLVGDVSGKGIPAALFMALSSSLLRAEAIRAAAPVDVLRRVNRQLLDRRMQSMFVTVFYGDLNLATRELRYVRAGHDFPLLWDASGNALPAPEGRSMPLGLFPDSVLDAQNLTLAPGAHVLVYTDGATEAMDADQELFGRERLFTAATADLTMPAQTLCDHLIETVTDYQPPDTQMDDITFLTLAMV